MRHQRLVETFVELADTLVNDFDVIEFLHILVDRSVELLAADAAGLLLATADGDLHAVASSNEVVYELELHQLRRNRGPCVHAYLTGEPVARPDLESVDPSEAEFAAVALAAGYRAVFAIPMRLRAETIGALSLFRAAPGPLDELSWRTAKGLVGVATIGLLQARSIRDHQVLAEQLQYALNSRIIIEQAKGVLAERLGLDVGRAFEVLRGHARARSIGLSDLAELVVSGAWRPEPDR
ncbi:GAF and ANTAR domain-containing protein [Actinokineospora enzanensis]|uniref:GAF and ANTAR domain-containing protein n=1 Tax=Actinokineospora enzanensis TaxID=155975 RepID=UPI0004779CF1|nr:GAF and ANTAR domain-containing protein [Actinokineospora enzanensis]